MDGPWVERSFERPNVRFRCPCGWVGIDDGIEDWRVERDRDRVVRVCPGCGEARPEWGALPSIEGAAAIARGPLREALSEAGVEG
ncbi:MAG: hypothetical protein ABEI39_06545 [Halobacteriales archaeon]